MYNRYWRVNVNMNGFKTVIMFEGTEMELRDYIDSELRYTSYRGATDKEYEAYKALGLPVYIAPKIGR